jgi:hypothetical protein
MGPLVALMIITVLSLLVVRIGATALRMTGLSHDLASFQACSAFFGVGYTTRESEAVVNHPVRRRIIRDLIIAGNVGITSSLAAVILTFLNKQTSDAFFTLGLIAAGLVAVWLLGRFRLVRHLLDVVIRWSLGRVGLLHAVDYDLLLRVGKGFGVAEVTVREGHSLVGRTLAEARVGGSGLIVLGISRADGTYIGAPGGSADIRAGDELTLYGRDKDVRALATESR